MIKNVEMFFEFLPYISKAPKKKEEMYKQACSNDKVTINSWRDIWLKNIRANKAKYGDFNSRSIGKFYKKFDKQPCIVVGSGPSLKGNVDKLKDTKGIPIVSCLHNFHFLEDNDVPVDFYVTLDAGAITLEEISEGGKKTHEEYLEKTKGKTLLAFIGSPPELLEQWRGDIYFFSCPLPDKDLIKEIQEIEVFNMFVSTGGNVLGACTYIAKGILGCNPIVFVGADFCFSYSRKFHAWDSKYDATLGNCLRAIDVFGNSVLTWQSYYNFKVWFDWLAETVPGIYINASEGGLFGAYQEGNIISVMQKSLGDVIRMYSLHADLKDQCESPEKNSNIILF